MLPPLITTYSHLELIYLTSDVKVLARRHYITILVIVGWFTASETDGLAYEGGASIDPLPLNVGAEDVKRLKTE